MHWIDEEVITSECVEEDIIAQSVGERLLQHHNSSTTYSVQDEMEQTAQRKHVICSTYCRIS